MKGAEPGWTFAQLVTTYPIDLCASTGADYPLIRHGSRPVGNRLDLAWNAAVADGSLSVISDP
jgi:hypothetical protein